MAACKNHNAKLAVADASAGIGVCHLKQTTNEAIPVEETQHETRYQVQITLPWPVILSKFGLTCTSSGHQILHNAKLAVADPSAGIGVCHLEQTTNEAIPVEEAQHQTRYQVQITLPWPVIWSKFGLTCTSSGH